MQYKFDKFNGISATEIELILRDMQSNYRKKKWERTVTVEERLNTVTEPQVSINKRKTDLKDIEQEAIFRQNLKLQQRLISFSQKYEEIKCKYDKLQKELKGCKEQLQEKQCGDKNVNIMIEQLNRKDQD